MFNRNILAQDVSVMQNNADGSQALLVAPQGGVLRVQAVGFGGAAAVVATTIASAAAVSSQIDNTQARARGLAVAVPSAWTAADIGFEVSQDASTWTALYDRAGVRVRITGVATAAAGVYAAPAETWTLSAYNYFRLVSLNTSTGANLNQVGARAMSAVLLV